MRRSQRINRKPLPAESSDEDEVPPTKNPSLKEQLPKNNSDTSSDESDIGNYLHSADKLDLSSSFFNFPKMPENKSEANKSNLIGSLSDSDSDDEEKPPNVDDKKPQTIVGTSTMESCSSSTKLNFKQLDDYTKAIEIAKKHAEAYTAKKQEENQLDIYNLLMTGEGGNPETSITLNSSDFESCDSEQEDWEEVKVKEDNKDKEKSIVSINGLQITVDMPNTVKKKKQVDLLAAMKRRLNRIRKENQVYVHKVHLLCWIAHGNYVNSCINNSETLALALSLLPSDKCYPSERTDLRYLEQILHWYKKTVPNVQATKSSDLPLDKDIQEQIKRKEATNKNMLVYIFVSILRSLGIQCRLVFSFLVEPLRPPSSDLHSLSTKDSDKTKSNAKTNSKHNTPRKKAAAKTKAKIDTGKKENDSKQKGKASEKLKDVEQEEKIIKDEKQETEVIKNATKLRSRTSTKDIENIPARAAKSQNKAGPTGKSNETKQPSQKTISNKSTKTNSKNVKPSQSKSTEGSSSKPRRSSDRKVRFSNSTKDNEISKNLSPQNTLDKTKKDTTKNLTIRLENMQPSSSTKSKKESAEQTKGNLDKKLKPVVTKTSKKRTCDIIKVKIQPKKTKTDKISQLDGVSDSDSDVFENSFTISDVETEVPNPMQVDGADDQKPTQRLTRSTSSLGEKIKKRVKAIKSVRESNNNSEDEFIPSPIIKKPSPAPKLNLQKLKKISPQRDKLSRKVKMDVRQDIMNLIEAHGSGQQRRPVAKRKSVKHDSDSDDFVPKEPKRRSTTTKKVLSSDSDTATGEKKKTDVWLEVFLEMEEKWISVDVVHGQVHCVQALFKRATPPVTYIVAWNNNNTIKDVTQRYCQNFNTVTRKLRTNKNWWEASIRPFMGEPNIRDKEEDDEFAREQLEKPIPTSIAEYKNHPLYVLQRHLLKFEGIYPPNAPSLGFVRNEPVYSRSCVYTLHSRDIWLKHAKVVKLGEKPYKIVKARPKWDKLSNTVITDQLLEIFGPWQVEDYVPPTAENGIVPRNAFGNVELFKPTMLPKKTVHLRLPGLNKVARRLNIDCASAIVGFDFHGGWSHPVYDGFVVCEEFEDQLVAAWTLDQEEMERKAEEKLEARVYGNWKILIKGLLIRERLKRKYDFGNVAGNEDTKKKKTKIGFCTKRR